MAQRTELLTTQRGKKMMKHRAYMYHHHSFNKARTRSYWRCFKREVCNVGLVSNADENNIVILKDGTENHLHPPDVIEVHVRKVLTRVRTQAQNQPNQRPSAIVREATRDVTNPEVLVNLPQRTAITRMINYQQNKSRPGLPTTLQDIVIPERYRKTFRGENFLLHDSGPEDPERLLIFSTAENLRLLSFSDSFYSDGTFKTVPDQFLQLFTVHGIVATSVVFPLVYVLTTRKTEETYGRIYAELINLANEGGLVLDPAFGIMDFERANINAFQTYFPNAAVALCLFHFSQSLYRQIVSKGLRDAYLNVDDPTVRQALIPFFGLPFVPLQHLNEVFELVVSEAPEEILEFADYVEVTYVKGRPRRGRRAAIPPSFPPQLWNVYQLVLNGRQRTNNVVEGWNSKFQKMVVSHHVNIWKFVENLQNDQHDNESLIIQLAGGHRNVKAPVNKRYLMNQNRVDNIVRNYAHYRDRGEIMTYLRAVAYHLKLNTNVAPPPADG